MELLPWRESRSSRIWRQMLLILTFLLFQCGDGFNSMVVTETIHQACLPSNPAMNATHEIFEGQDVIWQIPPNPRAILFLAHGGDKDPFSFFDRCPGCPQCYGLPEDRMAVLNALQEGYAVLALKSVGRLWSFSFEFVSGSDLDIAIKLLKTWTRRESLEGLPLVAWGQSAGGMFVTFLPFFLPVRSQVLMCSEGALQSLERAVPGEYPSTFFAYLNNNRTDLAPSLTTIYDVQRAEVILVERGMPVAEKLVLATPLSPSIFAERIHCISLEISRGIYEAFKHDGSWLDGNDYLVKDPFVDDWRSVLLKRNALPFCTEAGDVCLAEHVDEVLKVAQGIHTFMRDANSDIFAWLDLAFSSATV